MNTHENECVKITLFKEFHSVNLCVRLCECECWRCFTIKKMITNDWCNIFVANNSISIAVIICVSIRHFNELETCAWRKCAITNKCDWTWNCDVSQLRTIIKCIITNWCDWTRNCDVLQWRTMIKCRNPNYFHLFSDSDCL